VAPVRLAAAAPQVGESLTIAGYGGGTYRAAAGPCTQYLAPSVQHPQELVELAASARQGDSGGPIFNARGELAGVLFGEAGGRTTGAYCGRVHSFLALAVKELYQRDGSQLAVQPNGGPSQPAASVAGLTGGSPASTQSATGHGALAATAPEYWQNPSASTQVDPLGTGQPLGPRASDGQLVDDSSLDAAGTAQSSEPLAPASFYAATPSHESSVDLYSSPMGPVASIESPAIRDAQALAPSKTGSKQATLSNGVGPSGALKDDAQSADVAESSSLTWQIFAGETLIAQVKTVLACVGIVAILIHGTRAVARTSANSTKASAKRGKK
jgi:hypothetical protein